MICNCLVKELDGKKFYRGVIDILCITHLEVRILWNIFEYKIKVLEGDHTRPSVVTKHSLSFKRKGKIWV